MCVIFFSFMIYKRLVFFFVFKFSYLILKNSLAVAEFFKLRKKIASLFKQLNIFYHLLYNSNEVNELTKFLKQF